MTATGLIPLALYLAHCSVLTAFINWTLSFFSIQCSDHHHLFSSNSLRKTSQTLLLNAYAYFPSFHFFIHNKCHSLNLYVENYDSHSKTVRLKFYFDFYSFRVLCTHHIALTGLIVNENRNSLDYDTNSSFFRFAIVNMVWWCTFLTFAQFIIDIVVLFIGSMCSNLRSRFCSKIYVQK